MCMPQMQNSRIRIEVDGKTGEVRSIFNIVSRDELVKWPEAVHGAPLRIVCRDLQGHRRVFAPGPASIATATKFNGVDKLALNVEHRTVVASGEAITPCIGSGGEEDDASGLLGCGRGEDEIEIACSWSVELDEENPEISKWALSVDNRSQDYEVIEVLFPYVRGIQVGVAPEDSILIFPHHAGEKIENPASRLASDRYMKFWRAESRIEPDGTYSREINYCGLASMMWMDCYDRNGSGGLYMASYDSDFILTGIRSETGGPDDPWCGFGFRKYVPIGPGEVWSSHPYVLGVHSGDWHWASEQYRSWAEEHLTVTRVPDDLARESAICPRYDFKNGQTVRNRFVDIPEMYGTAHREHINHFLISGWNRQGFDTDYPEFIPDMELGSSWQLREGCRHVRSEGGFTTFYINVRLFDTESKFFDSLGRAWAAKGLSGEITHEMYGPRTFAVLCPGCGDWQDWAVDTASWMVDAFGARGIYLDQLGSATPLPCYDSGHEHVKVGNRGERPHHGLYNHGYVKMIERIKERCRLIDPSSFLMIENCGDVYSQYLYANLTWNGEEYDEFFNMYKYTFPEFIQVNMVNPRRIDDRDLRYAWFFRDLARAFVLGSVFWMELGDRFGPGNEELREKALEALRLRQQAAPYIARGTYRDDLGLAFIGECDTAPDPAPRIWWDDEDGSEGLEGSFGHSCDWTCLPFSDLISVTASRWTLAGGGVLILMSNPQRLKGKRVWVEDGCGGGAISGSRRHAIQYELGGVRSDLEVVIDDRGGVTLEVPESRLSFIAVLPKEMVIGGR